MPRRKDSFGYGVTLPSTVARMLAREMAATFVQRRAINATSQARFVEPVSLARRMPLGAYPAPKC